MKLFRWQKGWGKTGFELFPLIYWAWMSMDCYLLRYRTGTKICVQWDKAIGYAHYRFNITLKNAKRGGLMRFEKTIFKLGPFHLFRPDERMFLISPVHEGTKYILSFGWLSKLW